MWKKNIPFPTEGHRSTDTRDSPAKDDVPNKGRNLLLSGLVAFSAMFGYAIAAGLVQVCSILVVVSWAFCPESLNKFKVETVLLKIPYILV